MEQNREYSKKPHKRYSTNEPILHNGERQSLQQILGKTGYPHEKDYNWASIIYYTQKINSKWIIDLNIRPETIKLQEEIKMEKLHNMSFGKDFLAMIPTAQKMEAKK